MFCSKCGTNLPEGATFCHNCGTSLAKKVGYCPNCGTNLPDNVAFCTKCGAKIADYIESNINATIGQPEQSNTLNNIVEPNNTYGAFNNSGSEPTNVETVNTSNNNENQISDKFVWPLACSALFYYLIAFILVRMGVVSSICVTVIVALINCIFLYLDLKYLKSKGQNAANWIWLGIVFLPVYLGIRASKTNKNYIPLVVELILTVVMLLVPNSVGKAEAELQADKALMIKLEAQWDQMGVKVRNIKYDTLNNTIKMDVNATDGSTGKYTVNYKEDWQGKNVYVEVINVDYVP